MHAEFGDDPHRYTESGEEELLRHGSDHQKPLAPNGSCWPDTPATGASPTPSTSERFCALTSSPGARKYYDRQRDHGSTHHQALRALANRVGTGASRIERPAGRTINYHSASRQIAGWTADLIWGGAGLAEQTRLEE